MEVPPQHAPPLLLLQAPDILLQGEQAAVTVAVAAAAADAIHGATLRATAVHADSQQQLGLVAVGAAAPAQPSAEGGGASELGGRLVQHLGQVAAGEQRQVVLLLDVRYRGTVHLNVELLVRRARCLLCCVRQAASAQLSRAGACVAHLPDPGVMPTSARPAVLPSALIPFRPHGCAAVHGSLLRRQRRL